MEMPIMPFSTSVKRSRISSARLADRHGAGDVGGAVLILSAGIEQEQLAVLELAVGGARNAVMHDGAIRTGAGDGVEGDIAQRHLRFLAGLPARFLEPGDD